MSFGFSPSDFALLVQVAHRTFRNCQNAGPEYVEISREVRSLHSVLRALRTEAQRPDTNIFKQSLALKAELFEATNGCKDVLDNIETMLTRYGGLEKNSEARSERKLWQRLRFGSKIEELGVVRAKIITYTSTVSVLLDTIQLRAADRIETKVDGGFQEMNCQFERIRQAIYSIASHARASDHGSSTLSLLSLSTHEGDNKDVWQDFRRELIERGFKSGSLDRHRHVLQAYMLRLDQSGLLDQESRANSGGSDNTQWWARRVYMNTITSWDDVQLSVNSDEHGDPKPMSRNEISEHSSLEEIVLSSSGHNASDALENRIPAPLMLKKTHYQVPEPDVSRSPEVAIQTKTLVHTKSGHVSRIRRVKSTDMPERSLSQAWMFGSRMVLADSKDESEARSDGIPLEVHSDAGILFEAESSMIPVIGTNLSNDSKAQTENMSLSRGPVKTWEPPAAQNSILDSRSSGHYFCQPTSPTRSLTPTGPALSRIRNYDPVEHLRLGENAGAVKEQPRPSPKRATQIPKGQTPNTSQRHRKRPHYSIHPLPSRDVNRSYLIRNAQNDAFTYGANMPRSIRPDSAPIQMKIYRTSSLQLSESVKKTKVGMGMAMANRRGRTRLWSRTYQQQRQAILDLQWENRFNNSFGLFETGARIIPRAPIGNKSILKRPREAFPTDPVFLREGVAPKQASSSGIPITARWTKIPRNMVVPEALQGGRERYEAQEDCVVVLRVLTKDEIQEYRNMTRLMRSELGSSCCLAGADCSVVARTGGVEDWDFSPPMFSESQWQAVPPLHTTKLVRVK